MGELKYLYLVMVVTNSLIDLPSFKTSGMLGGAK